MEIRKRKEIQEIDVEIFQAIHDFQGGDSQKANFIYEKTKKYAYQIIVQHVMYFKNQGVFKGDTKSVTEDIMQELYLQFFENVLKFRNEDYKSFYKWISVVSNRLVLKYVDKNKMELLQEQQEETSDLTAFNDGDLESDRDIIPESSLEDKELKKLILKFIHSLPEVQAQTVLCHFYHGMKYQEIADLMGVSLITVKTRMKKAQDSLREIVREYENAENIKLRSVAVLPLFWYLYCWEIEKLRFPKKIDLRIKKEIAKILPRGGGRISFIGKVLGTKSAIMGATTILVGGIALGSYHMTSNKENTENKVAEETYSENIKPEDEVNTDKYEENTENIDKGEVLSQEENSQVENVEQPQNKEQLEADDEVANKTEPSDDQESDGTMEEEEKQPEDNETTEDEVEDPTKGMIDNPYQLGEKVVVKDSFQLEVTVTNYIPLEEAVATSGNAYNSLVSYDVALATVKIVGDGTDPYDTLPFRFMLMREDYYTSNYGTSLYDVETGKIDEVYNNVEYNIHLFARYETEETLWPYFVITYDKEDGSSNRIYIKLF